MKNPRKKWTPEENKKLAKLYPDKPNSELAKIFGVSMYQIKGKAQRMNLRKSHDHMERSTLGQFTKGMTPWNKGVSYMPKNGGTRFQKGRKPHTWKPVGTISRRSDRGNEWAIKVADTGTRSTDWRPLGEHVWVQAGFEPPTDDEVIRFKDGYKAKHPSCYKIDRLEKITRAENMERNTIHRYPEELKSAMRMIGKLKKEIEN